MISTRTLAAASLLALTFSVPAFAQDQQMMMMEDDDAMMVGEDGQMMMMDGRMTDAMMSMAQQNAQEVPEGTFFYSANGKLYMAQDRKMESGRMMSEEMMMGQ